MLLLRNVLHEPSARERCRVLPAHDGSHGSSLVFVNSVAVRILKLDANGVVVDFLFRQNILFAHALLVQA